MVSLEFFATTSLALADQHGDKHLSVEKLEAIRELLEQVEAIYLEDESE